MRWLFATDDSPLALVARTAVGLVMLPHGAQKLLGWFGGYGFSGTMGFFTEQMGLPSLVALLVILAESVGALLLIAGAATRVWAFLLSATMVGAIATMHWSHGFFMNWYGAGAGEGFEYHLLVLGITLPLLVFGPGRLSVDAWIADRLGGARPARVTREAHA